MTATTAAPEPQVSVEFGLWWPASDPGELRHLAAAWDELAVALDTAADELADTCGAVTAVNRGDAIDAYADHAHGWADGHLPDAATRCRDLAEACRSYADAVDEARDAIRQLAAEIAASLVIGIGLAILTAGMSAGAAAAVTAAAVARAGLVATSLAARVVAILSRVAVFATFGAGEAAATNLVIQTGRNIVTNQNHDPFAGFRSDELIITTTGGALLGAGLGTLRTLPLARAPELPPPPPQVVGVGRVVPGGGLDVHEQAGGHVLARHVGRSDADLADRLARGHLAGVSTFTSRTSAESAIAHAIDTKAEVVATWLQGGRRQLVIDAGSTQAVGRHLSRGATEAVDVFSVRVILRTDSSTGVGYRIQTAYPVLHR